MPSAATDVGGFELLGIILLYKSGQRQTTQRNRPLKLFGDFPISEAVDEVIVDHPDCLHVCMDNGGTHKTESALFQVFAEQFGFAGGHRDLLHDFPAVQFGFSTDKAPRVCIETVELLLNFEKRPRVAHSGLNFLLVSNNSWIKQ